MASIETIEPANANIRVEVVGLDAGLAITVPRGLDLVVLDPSGRDLGRIDARGTWRRAWPDDRTRPVQWTRVDSGRTLRVATPWIGTPPRSFDEAAATGTRVLRDWNVRLRVEGRAGTIRGQLRFERVLTNGSKVELALTVVGICLMLAAFALDAARRASSQGPVPRDPDRATGGSAGAVPAG
jgi:hypothetical protein